MHDMPSCGKIVLAGNPNVGKSTLFNLLTGKRVHIGNWSGKTTSVSKGYGVHKQNRYIIEDIPGIASISTPDAEEIAAFNTIAQDNYDCIVVVADLFNLQSSLSLLMRITELTNKVVLFINTFNEKKHNISINTSRLSYILGIPIVTGSAQKKTCLPALWHAIEKVCSNDLSYSIFTPLYDDETENLLASFSYDRKETIRHIYSSKDRYLQLKSAMSSRISLLSSKIENLTITRKASSSSLKFDKALSSPIFGFPIIFLFIFALLYITIVASNYPSQLLSSFFDFLKPLFLSFFTTLKIPTLLSRILLEGVYTTTATVIAVMLPPMIIFFPLFALLEEWGFLPRIAFHLDNTFKKCGSCGKQALTICMGLGCNCVGISSCAIIPSSRERLIAILTNSFTPCNGRFGAIIACISIFIAQSSHFLSAITMTLVLLFSFLTTLLSSKLLSLTILKGENAPFVLELPRFKKCNVIKVVISSLTQKTPSILLRAIAVAAPTGALICLLNDFNLLLPIASFLNPFSSLMGLDGIILLAFILSLPANEIVFPIMLMLYTHSDTMISLSSHNALFSILAQNHWTISTAVSFIIFTLMHYPCSTALLTIKSETQSLKWTFLSIIIPLLFGIAFSMLSNLLFNIFLY